MVKMIVSGGELQTGTLASSSNPLEVMNLQSLGQAVGDKSGSLSTAPPHTVPHLQLRTAKRIKGGGCRAAYHPAATKLLP